jgi:hypothetical protein
MECQLPWTVLRRFGAAAFARAPARSAGLGDPGRMT